MSTPYELWLEYMAGNGRDICPLESDSGVSLVMTIEYWWDARERHREVTYHVWTGKVQHEVFADFHSAAKYYDTERELAKKGY